jgi:hypothetical protein
MSPLDSKTTKRPSPLILPANDSAGELVNWPITESTCPQTVRAMANKDIIAKSNAKRSFTDSSEKSKEKRLYTNEIS